VPSIPVILNIADDPYRTKTEAQQVGASAFLTRPFSNALRETIARPLEKCGVRDPVITEWDSRRREWGVVVNPRAPRIPAPRRPPGR
jgi:hypothetical protein